MELQTRAIVSEVCLHRIVPSLSRVALLFLCVHGHAPFAPFVPILCCHSHKRHCVPGWWDSACKTPTCVQTCGNGGNCTAPGLCTCPSDWQGRDCRVPVCTPECVHGMPTSVHAHTRTLQPFCAQLIDLYICTNCCLQMIFAASLYACLLQ